MKRRGGASSERGARHPARLLAARANEELDRYAMQAWRRRQAPPKTTPRQSGVLRQLPTLADLEDAATWLRVRVPALYGPNSTREWVRALQHLAGLSVT